MKNRVPQIILAVLFVGALLVTRRYGTNSPTAPAQSPKEVKEAMERYGFHLEEVAAKSGIQFTHQAPTLDPKLEPIMPQVASMGAAVSIVDFDKDGWNDIYVCNSGEGSQNHLYRNMHDGTFKDVAPELGIADVNKPGTGVSTGAVWGDYDNDGYPDLLLYKWGKPELFHNDRGKGFTRVTEQAGLPAWGNFNSAIWVDYDHDGKLDLLLCGYFNESIDLWHLKDTRIMPESFEYATNGGRKYLLRNLGNGKFEDVTAKVGITSTRWTLAACAVDLHGTGYPDLVLANDYGITEVYANQGGKKFVEISKECGIGSQPKSGMNASYADINNEGKFALYVSNISSPEGSLIQGNNLWVPRAGSAKENPQFDNLAHDYGLELGGWSFGAQFGDLNNDGTQDLYLVNGYISADKNQSYWYDYSKVAGGNSVVIGDAKNWPAMRGRSLAGYEAKRVWVNDGAGKFTEVAQAVGATDRNDGRSVALGDFGNRGALDIVVANQKGPLLLYRNTVNPTNQWIDFDLEGTQSNRDAVGAEVRLFWGGQQQVQQVSAGIGFCAQNQHRLHFGLGKTPKIEKAEIRWPSGFVQTLTPAQLQAGKVNAIREPSGETKTAHAI